VVINTKQGKIIKELIKRFDSYPSDPSLKRINIFCFVGGLVGLTIGIFVDVYFWSFVYSHKINTPFFAYILSNSNSLYNPRLGLTFSNILAIPIFLAMIGILLGKGLEVLVRKNKYRS
jgi:hypothetical protein